MRVLVTGINGFVGQHVAKQLHDGGHAVIGMGMQTTLSPQLAAIVSRYTAVDLSKRDAVKGVKLTDIDAIINLAGLTQVGGSIGQGDLYNSVNVSVHINLYEECLAQNASPRVIAVSSGSVYDPSQSLPLTEDSKLIADSDTSEYTISKKHMELALDDMIKRGLDCIITRPFNHSGPGQLSGFIIPDLSEQLLKANSDNTPLMVGNLDTRRDYTDVRDVARAYVQLATIERSKLKHRIYNVCSGASVAGKEILQMLADSFGIHTYELQVDQNRFRPNDTKEIYGSYELLREDTEWTPVISVQQMIDDFVAWKKSS